MKWIRKSVLCNFLVKNVLPKQNGMAVFFLVNERMNSKCCFFFLYKSQKFHILFNEQFVDAQRIE